MGQAAKLTGHWLGHAGATAQAARRQQCCLNIRRHRLPARPALCLCLQCLKPNCIVCNTNFNKCTVCAPGYGVDAATSACVQVRAGAWLAGGLAGTDCRSTLVGEVLLQRCQVRHQQNATWLTPPPHPLWYLQCADPSCLSCRGNPATCTRCVLGWAPSGGQCFPCSYGSGAVGGKCVKVRC